LKAVLIKARATAVEDGIKAAYVSNVQNGNLDVFSNDNQRYQVAADEGNERLIDESGIPQLRQFCAKIYADEQLHRFQHIITILLPKFMNSMELILDRLASKPLREMENAKQLYLTHLKSGKKKVTKDRSLQA
jgi:hypothetical protein